MNRLWRRNEVVEARRTTANIAKLAVLRHDELWQII